MSRHLCYGHMLILYPWTGIASARLPLEDDEWIQKVKAQPGPAASGMLIKLGTE